MNHWHVALSVPVVALLVTTEYFPRFIIRLLSLYATPFVYISYGFSHLLPYLYRNQNAWFLVVFLYRYYRFFGHLFANYFLYAPAPIPARPKFTRKNVHVIIPTIDPTNSAFDTCIRSILSHHPKWLTIVTGGTELREAALTVASNLADVSPDTIIQVLYTNVQNKRVQVNEALMYMFEDRPGNEDTIIVCVDDHAWWKGDHFLEHLLAPFEDPEIALVGTRKEVARMPGTTWQDSFINLVGCLYLERHNFEITGQNALDGGVLVVSARTCAIRASTILSEDFMTKYIDERFFFNFCGPLNSDDDNFVTRYVLRQGWKIKFQNDAENATCTDIGIDGGQKLDGQLTRWARSQWRSNPASLLTEGLCWQHKLWWTSHAGYGAWLINFPLWMDALMWLAWTNCTWTWLHWSLLLGFMIGAKITKLWGHFRRHPGDLVSLEMFLYFIFTYVHVYYKIKSLLTFWDTTWSGRNLKSDERSSGEDENDSDGDNSDDESESPSTIPGRFTPSNSPNSERSADSPNQSNRPYTGIGRNGKSLSPTEHSTPDASYGRQRGAFSSTSRSDTPRQSSAGLSSSSTLSSRSSSFTPENSTKPGFGVQPNRFTPKGTFLTDRSTPWGSVRTSSPHVTPANVRESQVSSLTNQRGWQSPSPEVDVVGASPSYSPGNRSFTNRRPRRPSNVYAQPHYESVPNDYNEELPHTPPRGISPHYTVRKKSWTGFVPIPRASPTPAPRRSPRIVGKSSRDFDLSGTTRNSSETKQGQEHSKVIESAADFLQTAPLFRLPLVHVGEDHNGIPSPVRPVHNPLSPAPEVEDSGRKKREIFTRPKRPTTPAQPISLDDEERMTRQKFQTQNRSKKYERTFVRSCDCRRIHGSGTWLSVPSSEGSCPKCRSPPANVYDLRWR